MLSGVFDPFSRISGGTDNSDDFPAIHIGVVKSYIPSTNSAMVLVPTVNSGSAIGPCKVMKHYGPTLIPSPTVQSPKKGDKVIVAFIDGALNSAVVLGYL